MKFLKNFFHSLKSSFKNNTIRLLDGFLHLMNQPIAQKVCLISCFILWGFVSVFAQSASGSNAIAVAAEQIKGYKESVRSLMNAIAAIVVLVGIFTIFYKMNNGDQDVKKTIMLTIGGCIAFVALGQALPAFFGD